MMSRKTNLTQAPQCKKYLWWTVCWAALLAIPASVWTHGSPVLSVGAPCLGEAPRGGVELTSSSIPCAEKGDRSFWREDSKLCEGQEPCLAFSLLKPVSHRGALTGFALWCLWSAIFIPVFHSKFLCTYIDFINSTLSNKGEVFRI